jgi:hypothetical protein
LGLLDADEVGDVVGRHGFDVPNAVLASDVQPIADFDYQSFFEILLAVL